MTDPKCWLILCTGKFDGDSWWYTAGIYPTRKAAEWMIRMVRSESRYPSRLPKMEPVEMVRK